MRLTKMVVKNEGHPKEKLNYGIPPLFSFLQKLRVEHEKLPMASYFPVIAS